MEAFPASLQLPLFAAGHPVAAAVKGARLSACTAAPALPPTQTQTQTQTPLQTPSPPPSQETSQGTSQTLDPRSEGAGPEELHPALWRAHQIGQQRAAVLPSGFAALDAVLPGGGWPARALSELLLPHAGIGEMRLLAPVLAAVQAQQRGVMLFDPPALPFGWALHACGLDVQQIYLVQSKAGLRGRARNLLPAADILWALEQTLKSGHAGAALAWLPARLPADALRRLQLAAQSHDGPIFLLRDDSQRSKPSPAPLRLLLRPAGTDALRVQLLKRRGPPLAQALTLPLPGVLPAAWPALDAAMVSSPTRPT